MKMPLTNRSTKRPHKESQAFTTIELATSIAILTMLITAFAFSLNGIMKLEHTYSRETSAIIIAENALQRMAAAKQSGAEACIKACKEELEKNIMLDPKNTEISTITSNGASFMVITTTRGTSLLEIKL